MVDFANSEFYSANVSTLTTDFNVSPYYDDFDSRNNYYRILFKPGFAVQARELTQIQSILQDQIQKFGQHIFKEGSKVLGGKFDINKKVPYVKVKDTDSFDNQVVIETFKNQYVTGQTSGVSAYINLVLDGVESSQNTKTLYVTYISGNQETGDSVFVANEVLVSNAGTLVTLSSNTTGRGTVFTINEGVRFAKEHFIHHDKQSIVIDRYGSNPTCQVGFTISEDIINASQDSTLLDPALESSNFSAPGADRLKLTPELTRYEVDDITGPPDYVKLFSIVNGVVQELAERPIYNVIADEIAKRTADESGDYYVRGLNVQVLENLRTGNNRGLFTAAEGGNAANLTYMIEPGLAYVKGYEVETLVSRYISTSKSTAYENLNSQTASSRLGNWTIIKEVVGSWNMNSGQEVLLYDTEQKRITTGGGSTAAQTGKQIGSAKLKSLAFDSGTLGTANANLKLYLFDVKMLGSNSFANVRSVLCDSPGSSANSGADIVLNSTGNAIINEPFSPLIVPTGKIATKTIRSTDGTIDTTFMFKKTTDVTIANSGTFTITSDITGEIFPYGTTTLSSSDKEDIFLTLNDSFSLYLPGAALSAASSTLNGDANTRFTRLNVGDRIQLSSNTQTYYISSIANNSTLTVIGTLPTINGNTIQKVYKAGDMIDLKGVGSDAGDTRVVSSTSTSLSFDLKENMLTTTSRSGTVTYNLSRTSAKEVAKTLRIGRYVKINVAAAGSTSGPFKLGFSDVYRITAIRRKNGSAPTSITDGDNLLSNFIFDTGQRDSYYGHSAIKSISSSTLAANDWLLIELDYFQPDFTLGVGYFSVDSYPINDTSPSASQITTAQIPVYLSETGKLFDLRNCLDFRPVYRNTAIDTTDITSATVNPSDPTTFIFDSGGIRSLAESEQITFDFSYYLPRIDIIALNREGVFSVINGVPAARPTTPEMPQDLMSLAKVFVSAYPSISTEYARAIQRMDLGCLVTRTSNIRFTMRDIGVLKNRIDNLEQYVSLNTLEKSTFDLKILDENKLDRFKNGIFVDSFADDKLSMFYDPANQRISFDPYEKSIRPVFEMESLKYQFLDTQSTNVVRKGDYVLLPYTEQTFIDQPYATTERNVETTVYRFVGNVYLEPELDYWVDTQRIAANIIPVGDQNPTIVPYRISYGSWQFVSGGSWQRTNYDWWGWGNWNTLNQQLLNMGWNGEIQYYYDNDISGWVGAFGGYLGSGYSSSSTLSVDDVLKKSTTTTLGTYAGKPGQGWEGGISPSDLFTIYTRQRSVTQTLQEVISEYTSLGDKVVDVAPIVKIRPQVIAFGVTGLKGGTRHHVFFDGQKMNDYVTPSNTKPILSPNLSGTADVLVPRSNTDILSYASPAANRLYQITPIGSEGSAVFTNPTGTAYGLLRIPSDATKSFTTGSKEFIITDSPTNEDDATSLARTFWTAQGILQTKQEQIISTKKVVEKQKTWTETTTGVLIYDRVSCMGYSFIPKCPEGDEGVFITGFDVFFSQKDPNLGVWFEIRAMDNAGGITRTQVPMSEVWLKSSDVLTSTDASVPTNVKFITPVFLRNDTEYALIVHTEGINPNYYMWVSVLGQEDTITKKKVNQRGLTGNLYTTNNNLDWDIVPRVDLKFKLYRAKFNTNVTGTAYLGNEPVEFIAANTVSSPFTVYGEPFVGDDKLVLTPVGTGGSLTPIVANSRLIGANSGSNSRVVTISGSTYTMSNTGYQINEIVRLMNANGSLTSTNAYVVSKNTAAAILYNYIDTSKNVFTQFRSSNGLFTQGETIRGLYSRQSAVVQSIRDFVYSTVQFEPSYITFTKTVCNFDMRSVRNTGSIGPFTSIYPSTVVDFDDEMIIYSRTKELDPTKLSGDRSNKVKVTMSSQSDFLSPVIDVSKSYTVYIHNIINSNTANILSPTGSGLINQYISQVITLADGQDAEDLRVVTTAYRPPTSNSNFMVYVRYSHNEDFEPIERRNWIPMDYFNSSVYSSLANRYDFLEYSFNLPASVLTGTVSTTANVAQYRNSANTLFTGFRQFQLKIGLQSDNSAIVPRLTDIRAIALQK